jgi:hypothetical protein
MDDNFSSFNQRLKYAHYRPSLPVKSDPRYWRKYAYKVVVHETKKARCVFSAYLSLASTWCTDRNSLWINICLLEYDGTARLYLKVLSFDVNSVVGITNQGLMIVIMRSCL